MKITVLGSGPAIPVKGRGRNERMQSSYLIETDKLSVLINAPPSIEQLLIKYDIEKLDYVFLSHKHHDICGGIFKLLNYFPDIKIVIDKENYNLIPVFKKISEDNFYFVEPYTSYTFDDLGVILIEVFHTEEMDIKQRCPTYGYKINNSILITDDMCGIPDKSFPFCNNLDIWIIDAFGYYTRKKRKRGHLTIHEVFDYLYYFRPKLAILTRLSKSYTEHYKAQIKIRKDANYMGIPTEIYLAYDGMTLNINNGVSII